MIPHCVVLHQNMNFNGMLLHIIWEYPHCKAGGVCVGKGWRLILMLWCVCIVVVDIPCGCMGCGVWVWVWIDDYQVLHHRNVDYDMRHYNQQNR